MIEFNQQPMFVLKRTPYREQQYLLDILTKDFGRIRASSRIPTTKTHRETELFAPFQKIIFSGTRKHSLASIRQPEIQYSLNIASKNLLAAYYLNELVLSLLPEDDQEAKIFVLYERTLTNLNANSIRWFEFSLIKHLGLWPDIKSHGHHYLISQYHEMPYFTASAQGFDANLIEILSNGQWIENHPQLKSLLQTIISIHSTRRQYSKKTALAINQLIKC